MVGDSASVAAQMLPAARSQRIARHHVEMELTNAPDAILGSMRSAAPMLTAVIEQRSDGQRLTTCSTPAEQREHYVENRGLMTAIGAEVFTAVGSDWYAFLHGTMSVRVHDTGATRCNEWVGLFPITPHEETIAGEIGLSWPPCAKRGDDHGIPSTSRSGAVATSEAWIAAVRNGDADCLSRLYVPDALGATRAPEGQAVVPLRGRPAFRTFYGALFDEFTVESVEVLARIVDRWFVFTELDWVLRDPRGSRWSRRTGHVLVHTEADEVAIDLGYGTTAVAAREHTTDMTDPFDEESS